MVITDSPACLVRYIPLLTILGLRFGASNSLVCKLAGRRRENRALLLSGSSVRIRGAGTWAEEETRSSILVHRRNAFTREENAGYPRHVTPYTCRKELSKISNPTNLVGELPRRWCTRLRYGFLYGLLGIYFFFTCDGYIFAIAATAGSRT